MSESTRKYLKIEDPEHLKYSSLMMRVEYGRKRRKERIGQHCEEMFVAVISCVLLPHWESGLCYFPWGDRSLSLPLSRGLSAFIP